MGPVDARPDRANAAGLKDLGFSVALNPKTLELSGARMSLDMVPYYPLPSLKGSEVWALGLYRACKGYVRGDHAATLRLPRAVDTVCARKDPEHPLNPA